VPSSFPQFYRGKGRNHEPHPSGHYNAEGNITAVDPGNTPPTEAYIANGQRVSEWNGTTRVQLKGKYYWGGKPVAFYTTAASGSAGAHFEHQDWMGTERLRTAYNANGNPTYTVEGTFTSLPWGDGPPSGTGSDLDANHYATLDHDSETDTDHAQFRQYSNTQGRWLSPDPYGGSYNASNPQSFNRYVYAMNNPLSNIDPSGLDDCGEDGGEDYCYDAGGGGDGGFGGGGGFGGFGGFAGGPAGSCDYCSVQICSDGQCTIISDPEYEVAQNGKNPFSAPSLWTLEQTPYDWYIMVDKSGVIVGQVEYIPDSSDSLGTGGSTWASGGRGGGGGNGGGGGVGAPNNANQPSWQQKMRQAAHYICGQSPGERVARSVITGAAIGAGVGAVTGFVGGEVFGGEVTFGVTGIPGAYLGAHVGGAVGAMNGLTNGAVLAGICYAGFMYDNN
jgi:RHS repeat-associated protein